MTVVVVFQSVVADHHHHHSLECEPDVALVMKIADVVAHAIDPPLLFSLHRQAEELEVILVEIQGNLADVVDQDEEPRGSSEGPRDLGQKRTSRSSKKANFGGGGVLVSSRPSVLRCGQVGVDVPNHLSRNTTVVHARGPNAVLKKSN